MADVKAVKTGNWSDTTVWNTSALPTSADNVYSNGFTVTIDINPTVALVSNRAATGITGSGSFTLNSSRILTANIEAGPSGSCVNFSGTSSTIVGNITGSNTTGNDNYAGVANNSSGTITISGNLYSGTNLSRATAAVSFFSNGTIYIYGNLYGNNTVAGSTLRFAGPSATVYIYGDCYPISDPAISVENANATIYLYGNVYGVTGSGANAGIVLGNTNFTLYMVGSAFGPSVNNISSILLNSGTGTVYLTGVAVGGTGTGSYAIYNNIAGGSVFINGTAVGGVNSVGVLNNSTGTVYITKVKGNDYGLGSVGIGSVPGAANSQNGKMYVEQVEFGPRGQTPISGPVYILPSNRNTLVGYTTAAGTPVTFYNSLSVTDLLPPVSSVRLGTVYNVGNSTGTMAVPSASAVQFGVAVDNTTGTAALQPQDVWGYARLSATQVNSMGDRLRNVATTQSVGQQIASFNL